MLGFVGVGVMGEPMCRNLAQKSGEQVCAFDMDDAPLERLGAVEASRIDAQLSHTRFEPVDLGHERHDRAANLRCEFGIRDSQDGRARGRHVGGNRWRLTLQRAGRADHGTFRCIAHRQWPLARDLHCEAPCLRFLRR